MKFKRIMAYILDILLVILLSSLILVPFIDKDYTNKKNEITFLYTEGIKANLDRTLSHENFQKLEDEYKDFVYTNRKNKTEVLLKIVLFILFFVFFAVIPYFNSGQTVFKKLFKIKALNKTNEEMSMIKLFLRSSLNYGFIIMSAILYIIMIFANKKLYFTLANSNSILKTGFIALNGLMLLLTNESLVDSIIKTKVISTKEKEVKL